MYDQTSPLAYGLALRILADDAAAERALAEAYAEARRQGRLGLGRQSVVWLLREVRTRSLAGLASGPTAPRRPAARVEGSVPFTRRDRAALEGLGAMDRQLLELAYFERLSSRDIGGRIGVDEKTVSQRLRAALGFLHERSHAAEEAGS
jgi:DNA-directed RNA polymerase specialized sigma24 family protein